MPTQTADMKSIVAELSSRNQQLAKVIAQHKLCTLASAPSSVSNFEALAESVVSQQLSVKAADTIYGRLLELCQGQMLPQKLVELTEGEMRSVGLSGAKTKTIQGMAGAALSGAIEFEKLHLINDEAVSQQLNGLWGIGPWTIDMFMMHQLHRLDIWPVGDLGVRRGWQNIFQLESKIEPADLAELGEEFRPYRSVVAWYCWRAA